MVNSTCKYMIRIWSQCTTIYMWRGKKKPWYILTSNRNSDRNISYISKSNNLFFPYFSRQKTSHFPPVYSNQNFLTFWSKITSHLEGREREGKKEKKRRHINFIPLLKKKKSIPLITSCFHSSKSAFPSLQSLSETWMWNPSGNCKPGVRRILPPLIGFHLMKL